MGLIWVKLLLSKGYKVAAASRNIADLEKQVGSVNNNFLLLNGTQPGDPQKLSQILIDITELEHPPVHLLAGPDAYQMVQEKIKEDEEEREAWKNLTLSTNLDEL